MKAFLLAAGNGTRLYPLTARIPKCLAPIRGQPMLGIWLELLRRSGVDQVLVNVHAHIAQVRDFLASQPPGITITVSEEPELLGSAGTLRANSNWVRSQPFFWVLYADVLTNARLDRMLAFHKTHSGAATLGVCETSHPERCGISVVDGNNCVVEFVEKPSEPRSRLAFTGLLIGTPALLDAVPASVPADLGFDVLPRLTGQMFAYSVPDFLLDIGTLENYAIAQTAWPGL